MKGSTLVQALKQIWGILVLEHKYKEALPNTDNYHSDITYSLPFDGSWVTVNGGVTKETSHSWEVPTQRYAYDFVILDETGSSFCGEDTKESSFYCYGRDILAAADGTVVETGEGNPDSQITKDRSAVCDARDIRGNYILISHSENEYSLSAHLRPGSILVSAGQSVKRGEKLAECGNSGNTTEPHLHFHIQMGKSFYSSPGLPVRFGEISVQDTPNYGTFDDRHLDELCRPFYPPYIGVGQTVCNADPMKE